MGAKNLTISHQRVIGNGYTEAKEFYYVDRALRWVHLRGEKSGQHAAQHIRERARTQACSFAGFHYEYERWVSLERCRPRRIVQAIIAGTLTKSVVGDNNRKKLK